MYFVRSMKSFKQSKVKKLQDKIDKLVYRLYGLTEKEIKIIEGDNK